MMTRRVVATLLSLILFASTVFIERRLAGFDTEDPLGRRLLYLPSLEGLQLISLGNDGLAADVLYLWSIQYYSQYRAGEEFLYLEKMMNLITDLDPLYRDPYLIGGLIMGLSRQEDEEARVGGILRLYRKGLENLPNDWRLAETAAWDAFQVFKRREAAIEFLEHGVQAPGAPHHLRRILGVWKDREREWTVEDSIRYWERTASEATNKVDLRAALSHLYDAYVIRDRRRLEPVIRNFSIARGFCPEDFEPLVQAGFVDQIPLDRMGNPYAIDPEGCTLMALKRIRVD